VEKDVIRILIGESSDENCDERMTGVKMSMERGVKVEW
jgi:hypothetical protein